MLFGSLSFGMETGKLNFSHKDIYEDLLSQGLTNAQIVKTAAHSMTRLIKIVSDCKTSGKVAQSTINAIKREAKVNNPNITDEQLAQEIDKSSKSFCSEVLVQSVDIMIGLSDFLSYAKSRQNN